MHYFQYILNLVHQILMKTFRECCWYCRKRMKIDYLRSPHQTRHWLFWTGLTFLGKIWTFLDCPKMPKNVQKCPKTSKDVQKVHKCPKMSKKVQKSPKMSNCPKTSKNVQKRPKIPPSFCKEIYPLSLTPYPLSQRVIPWTTL